MITGLQRKSGDIPWHAGGKTDPWDLVESVMGLNISGFHDQAMAALNWLAARQNKNGSWYSSYMDSVPEDRTAESHMACYLAVGLFHQFLIKGDKADLEKFWSIMSKGVGFALGLQAATGEIYWAKSPEGKIDPMSLLSGSSSIFMSLKCALAIADILGHDRPEWENTLKRLGRSIRENIFTYNVSKSRFSMYWFYPILSGVLQGRRAKARIVFSWIHNRVFEDQIFWCGYTYPDMVVWPEDKISWTNAVILMAADALYGLTPGARLFDHDAWDGCKFKCI